MADARLHMIAPWRLYGESDGLALAGEVDVFTADLLDLLLSSGESNGTGDEVLDVSELEFIDHAAMHVLKDHALRLMADGRNLVIRGESRSFARVADLVDTIGEG